MSEQAPERPARKRTIDLLPTDIHRLSQLAAHYRKTSRVTLTEIDVMRLAWEDACVHHGLSADGADGDAAVTP